MKICFFEVEPWEKTILKKDFSREHLSFSSSKLTLKNVKDCEILSVFIYSKIDKLILDKMPSLKLITTRSTGYDHIDLKECAKRNIIVSNVPDYGENTVAENAFALILALSRKIVPCVEKTQKFCFDLSGLRGFDLAGKTLGIIGCGNIGKHMIRMAKGFQMKILVFDVHKERKLARMLGFTYVSMETLLKKSDLISLHVPYNQQTHHLISAKEFRLMKKGTYLINTSRGAVVDTTAMISALKSGKLVGAGLDVLEHESRTRIFPQNKILLKMSNVIITPHNAFNTHEALMRILQTTIKTIKKFKKGKKFNVVS